MSIRLRATTTNPLIQRVRRHQGLTTLFRSGQSAAMSPVQRQQSNAPATVPVAWVMGRSVETAAQVAPTATSSTDPVTVNQTHTWSETAAVQAPVTQAVGLPAQPRTTLPQAKEAMSGASVPAVVANMPMGQTDRQPTHSGAAMPTARSTAPALLAASTQSVAHQSAVTQPPAPTVQRAEAQSVQRPVTPAATPPAMSTALSESTTDDRTWSRLEAIMAAHRRQEMGEPVSSERTRAAVTPIQREVKPSQRSAPPLTRAQEAARESRPEIQLVGNVSTDVMPQIDTSVHRPAVTEESGASNELTHSISGSAYVESSTSKGSPTPAQTMPPKESGREALIELSAQPNLGVTTQQNIQRQIEEPDEDSASINHSAPVEPVRRQNEIDAGMVPGLEQRSTAKIVQHTSVPPEEITFAVQEENKVEIALPAEEPLSESHQPLPLQEAWPGVRQITLDRDGVDEEGQTENDGGVEPPDSTAYLERTEVSNAVQAALRQVETARPTESAVHVIPPRRPRPRIQRSPATRPPEGGGKSDPPSVVPGKAGTEPRPLHSDVSGEVAETDGDDGTEAIASLALIETQIGALPADLWRLIDEPVPKQTAQSTAPTCSDQSASAAPPPPVIQAKADVATSSGSELPVVDPPAVKTNIEDEVIQFEKIPMIGQGANAVNDKVTRAVEEPVSDLGEANSQRVVDFGLLDNQEATTTGNYAQTAVVAEPIEPTLTGANPLQFNGASKQPTSEAPVVNSVLVSNHTGEVVQRQPEEASAGVTIEDVAPQVENTAETKVEIVNRVDIDELACEVYSMLRRRLVIESERFGF